MKTKLLTLLVALCATFALWAQNNVITYAATEKLPEVEDLDFSGLHIDAFGVTISSHTFSNGEGTITFAGEVTTIGDHAFYGCRSLTSITIPNTVTTIGDDAFYGCSGLIGALIISNSVTTIGDYAFDGCSGLTSVTIPNSVTTIGERVFSGCSGLTSVTIPNSVTTIGKWAFDGCRSLTSVTIPNSVTTIGDYAFFGCRSLASVTIPNSVTTIGDDAFYNCTSLTSVTIGNSVTTIGDKAFYGCTSLKTVYNGSKLDIIIESTTHGYVAYYADIVYDGIPVGNLIIKEDTIVTGYIGTTTDVIIPNGIITIEDDAFLDCTSLTSVTISNSVTTIGEGAFDGCSGLKSVTIGNSVTTIGAYAFAECVYLTKTYYTGTVADWCKISFGGPIANPLDYSLYFYIDDVEVKDLVIPEGVDKIGKYAFERCNMLTSVTIPNSVTAIGDYAFNECQNMTTVSIGNSVTTIGKYAFNYCTDLTSITLPSSVTTIGESAFHCCFGLTSIICYALIPPACSNSLCWDYVKKSIPVYVPTNSVDTYKQADVWKEFTNILPISAEPTQTTELNIEPTETEVTITWPKDDNASSYSIEITQDGVVFCTLKFNAQGQLIGIAFAPSRGMNNNATDVASGFKFTITNLTPSTTYGYVIVSKDALDQIINSYSGTFTTKGGVVTKDDQLTTSPNERLTKVIKNNQLFIRRGDKIYNAAGQKVK
ncbi:MAG: leucine-rich repeat domain-containing protein [Paludibacteraceae bacterium]|nr:leucine-rich repeat domain-containing protein [Paludibacteraceae bacterium]